VGVEQVNETLVTVVGYVISPISQRQTGAGEPGATFRVASTERRYDKESQAWVDGDQLFVSVSCWRKLALGVIASLEKGDPVIVRGRLHTRSYAVDGAMRTSLDLVAYQIGPDLARCQARVQRMRKAPSASALESAEFVGASLPEQRESGSTVDLRTEPDADSGQVRSDQAEGDSRRPALSAVAP